LRGLQLFLGTINELRSGDEINPALDVLGIVPTFYNSRLLHHQAALAELEELQKIGLPVLVEMAIGQTVRVPEALALGRPLHVYMPGNPQVRAFQQLADFVEVRCLRNEQPTRP
jgi:cellulose biosynthesis protein BcsQ